MNDTTTKGFTIAFDTIQHILKLQLWGFWDEETAQHFASEFQDKVREVGRSGKAWYILADITCFPPQAPKIQPFLNGSMILVKQHGVKRAARIVDNTITKLQIARLSKESGLPEYAFFKSEDEAIQWLSGAS